MDYETLNNIRKLRVEYEHLIQNGTRKQQVEARLLLKLLEKKHKQLIVASQDGLRMPWS